MFLERIAVAEEALTITQTLHERDMEALIFSAKAAYLTMAEHFDQARSAMLRALVILRDELLDQRAVTLQPCIALAVQDNDFDRAARILGYRKADSRGWIRETQRVPMDIDAVMESMRDRLGEVQLEQLMVEGASWSPEQAFEEALAACKESNRT
jgi:hypothetical protein